MMFKKKGIGMRKLFLSLVLILCSLAWLNCKVTIVNKSEKKNLALVLLLKYTHAPSGAGNYYFHTLDFNETKVFDFKIGEKKNLSKIIVYLYDEKRTSAFTQGSIVNIKDLRSKELMSVDKIEDGKNYLITSDGQGWAEEAAA